jgi:hypothetical protein
VHIEQGYALPVQVGLAVKIWVPWECIRVAADLQQIWYVQSLLCVQVFSQVAEQRPLQQIGADADVQLDEVVQVLGQLSYFGFKHRPDALRLGSRLRTDVQQISPAVVLQSLLVEQVLGHCEAGRQMG